MKTVSLQRYRSVAVMLVTAAAVLLTGTFGASVQAGVVFWNKLGSDEQAMQSEVGPPLMRQGSVNYEPGRFGNGVRIDSTTFPGYFLLDESLINSMILRGRGTIALWVKTSWPSTGDSGAHIFFDTNLGGGPERMGMGQWFDNGITIYFFPGGCNEQIDIPGTYSDHGIHFQAGEWHHWEWCGTMPVLAGQAICSASILMGHSPS